MCYAPTVCQACLNTPTSHVTELPAVAALSIAILQGTIGAQLVPQGRGAGFVLLPSCGCSESWTLEAPLVTSWASCSLLMGALPICVPAPALILTVGLTQASNWPSVSSIQLLTPPPGPAWVRPLVMLLWMALEACWPQMPLDTVGGGGRTRQKQLQPQWSQGHTKAALYALVSATPIPCIVGQQQPRSDTEAEEFPLSWNLGMGWPLPVSDILLLKGLPPAPLCLGRPTT